ncbi:hypothetical protein [Allorhodopirellula heiligendammensis]|uniref:Secreted protein n=1 Tax=Allorhodopirellula heiligendammensis TaxID=2714739 RepID=A0A5C6C4H6_9BACT|nr:hypothetical protein [Allorhodopirellula heiligendammensis]TWU19015.1 hypothetical protein Poly21_11860 [Allorhodopirellula heiligendammensis]|tara:strand:- start:221 stop:460 length:240 start_codon:yes stop_codon:yes gene_type:complete
MTHKFLSSIFALAILTTTLGCPPPAPPTGEEVDISTEQTADVSTAVGDNMTGVAEVPSDNMTGVTEVPSDNMTTGSETP